MIYDFYHNSTWIDCCSAEQCAMLTAILTTLYGDIRMVVRGQQETAPVLDFCEWLKTISAPVC